MTINIIKPIKGNLIGNEHDEEYNTDNISDRGREYNHNSNQTENQEIINRMI